jgi:hypothetical protein
MFNLNYLHKVTISDVPLEWMTRLDLFSSDLEQFPMMYVHLLADKEGDAFGEYNPEGKQRIFGFVLAVKWGDLKPNSLCDIEIEFVCNIKQRINASYDKQILEELSHRIGHADRVGFKDLSLICTNSKDSLPLLEKIWTDKIEAVYGQYIPHGRIFDEMYGIIRFSASGNAPRLGKTSEMRMLYWYMYSCGEKVEFLGDVSHLKFIEFYLLPTYDELLKENFSRFKQFSSFYLSTKVFWEKEYTNSFSVGAFNFKCAPKTSLPSKSDAFEERFTKLLNNDDYDNISRLRQIFNRMPSRLYGYIWNIMTPVATDFRKAFSNRSIFKEFYKDHSDKKGSSSKVIACFLQQAFGIEAFPIDTWVKTFIYYPLGMKPKDDGKGEPGKDLQDDLYSKYNRLDKLEKLIWVSSMGNKTNKKEFMDILWCQRYGTDKGDQGPCRGANPLACSQCILNSECLSYKEIKDEYIYVSDDMVSLEANVRSEKLFFGVHTSQGTPRRIFVMQGNKFVERDSHSGLDIPKSKCISNGKIKLDDFVGLI